MARGYCVKTISSEEFYVDDTHLYNGKTWWELRPYFIYLPSESWAEIKSFIIKICAKTKRCGVELEMWEDTIDKIDSKIVKKE